MTGSPDPVRVDQIADLLAQARALTNAGPAADPAARAAYLMAKAQLLSRIAEQHHHDQRPCHLAEHARHLAAAHAHLDAHQAAAAAATPDQEKPE